jgi:hypothetical protein
VVAVLVVDVGIRALLYMNTTIRRAAKLLPLNHSISHIKPPAQLLP